MNARTLALAAVVSFGFTACSDFDPVEDTSWNYSDEEKSIINSFNENFVMRYGAIDPVHTWGFEELSAEPADMKTRSVYTNRNEWTASVKEDNVIVEYTTTAPRQNPWDANSVIWDTEGGSLDVPGFPSDVDGKYYVEGNMQDEIAVYDSQEALKATGKDRFSPVGDVTQEEILYVSKWFRENRYPGSIEVELTDFFIQDISQDKDRLSYPDGLYDPAKSTNVPTYNSDGTLAGYSNVAYGMDYFSVHTSAADPEHINNFNKSKANPIKEVNPNDPNSYGGQELRNRTIMWWNTNGGVTTDFSYHNSDDGKTHDNYVLVYLSFEGPQTGLHYEGYYLAFDYECEKVDDTGKKTTIEPDGYYSNWIVKLSPGKNIPEPPTKKKKTEPVRIMCEDLGNTYDFDFNDLVFDVYYTYEEGEGGKPENIEANITVQAAGGTLPIYLGPEIVEEREAHHLLGASVTSVPINVGSGDTRNPVSMVIPATSTNPDDIDIYVGGISNKATVTILPKSSTISNRAPQKIATETSTRWLKESQQIEWGYPDFNNWVNDRNTVWINNKVTDYLYY